MNKPKYIIIHHTAVSYDKNPDQFEATDRYHKSKGWGMIGYHYEIAKDGTLHKGRDEEAVGAHAKEQMMNYKSIGICLDGNFDIEMPTDKQINTLTALIIQLMEKYDISENNIYPHRHFATYKSCYGSLLPDNWARLLVINPNTKYMFKLIKQKDQNDVYAVHEGMKSKIGNEYTFDKGVQMRWWDGEIEEVQHLDDYKDGQEFIFSPMDK